MLDLVQEELESYGTGGGERLTDSQIATAIQALEAVSRRLGTPLELPFRDFTWFRSYWIRRGASGAGGWQARRDLIEELLEPTRKQLLRLEETPGDHATRHSSASHDQRRRDSCQRRRETQLGEPEDVGVDVELNLRRLVAASRVVREAQG